jgi:O-antigen ligase
LAHLTDSYYHWFRNDAAGKITDLGNHFFRIVLPDHLLLVPIILMLTSRSIAGEATNKNKVLLLLLLGVLVLNFSRIYFLALPIGLILLYRREKMRQWLLTVTLLFFSLTAIFISTHFLASRGTSFGLELVGLRASGVKNLTSDPSGEIRLAILPDALRQIKERPLFGSGLGASITYVDPGTRLTVTRTQFDWGYLEMIAEFGIIGTLFFVLFYAKLFFAAYAQSKKYADTAHGFAAGIASLCCINITTPALFHGFGILYTLAILFWLQTTKDVCPE